MADAIPELKMRAKRGCSCFGKWREAGDLVTVHGTEAALALIATGRAEPADARTAEALQSHLPTIGSVRAAKRAAWRAGSAGYAKP